jgi:hypothetical protein
MQAFVVKRHTHTHTHTHTHETGSRRTLYRKYKSIGTLTTFPCLNNVSIKCLALHNVLSILRPISTFEQRSDARVAIMTSTRSRIAEVHKPLSAVIKLWSPGGHSTHTHTRGTSGVHRVHRVCMRKVVASYLDRDTGYCRRVSFVSDTVSRTRLGKCAETNGNRFLPNPYLLKI